MFIRFSGKICALTALAIIFVLPMAAQDLDGEDANPPSLPEGGPLTLCQALALALAHNPELSAFGWELRAADARVLQAGLRPNPELDLEVEQIRLGSGPVERSESSGLGFGPGGGLSASWDRERSRGAGSGLDGSEITLSISQLIELGGKRAKRTALAEREKDLAQWDYETARANVAAEVALAFVEVLAAQERAALHERLVELAGEVKRVISLRVEAGQVSPIELGRAEIALATARVDADHATGELAAARLNLAALWGSTRDNFGEAMGPLDEIQHPTALQDLTALLEKNPDVARWAGHMAAREAQLDLARAMRLPDPGLGLGWKSTGLESGRSTGFGFNSGGGLSYSEGRSRAGSDRDNTLVLGFSIPLPLFDRNQGDIAEAEYLIEKTRAEQRAAETRAQSELAATYHRLSAACTKAETLRDDVVPLARETFEKTQEGYRQGKFSYLEVLDAQRTFFDAQTTYLSSLETYHQYAIRMERLIGESIHTIGGNTETPPREQDHVEK